MTNKKWEEIILVANREAVFAKETLTFQGVLTDLQKAGVILGNMAANIIEMRRGNAKDDTSKENNAEINLDFLQPIPYAVIRRGKELFVYERLNGGGEGRLHNKLSIGVGGHMNMVDSDDFSDALAINLYRELTEELKFDTNNPDVDVKVLGLINDDSEDVSKVHLGVLAMIDVSEDTVIEVREKEELAGSWKTIDELKEQETYDRLESWSQIVMSIL